MTRRKDPQPETLQPEPPPIEPFVAEVDPTPVAASDPAGGDVLPEPPPLAPAAPAPRRAGLVAPLFGGAMAAIGGFALSHFNLLGLAQPSDPVDLAPLAAQVEQARAAQDSALDKLSAEVTALAARVATLESAPPPDMSGLDAVAQRLAAIEAMPSGGSASTAALTAKVIELEQRLAALPTSNSDPALQQKLDDALARLSEAEAATTARAAEAEAATAKAVRDTALTTLSDAVATGQPFTTELQALADPVLTDALGSLAESGAPTLVSLQQSFPDAAREALRIARDLSTDTGWSDRLVDFLAAQTGARPLTPQDGETPEAMLSRAEYALSEGRVADALAELAPLDPAVKAPLDLWTAAAKAHLAAGAALQAARGE